MKHLSHLCIAVMATALLSLTGCVKEPEIIKVMSYNIRLSIVDDGENHWNIRKPGSVLMINTLQPHIIGLQEPVNEQITYLLENLPNYAKIGVARDDGDTLGEFSAVFYLKDIFELLDDGTFWLSETPEIPSFGWDAACKRVVSWGHLKNKKTGTECYVFNTHFDHKGKIARLESARLLAEKMEEIAHDCSLVFLTGDFNAAIDDPLFDPLKAGFLDARQEAPMSDTITTYHAWGQYDGPAIDHIFYRGAKAISFRTVTEVYQVSYVSDHYPLIAVFEKE
ncbi:MAG: endonuclease/exonuclease/phosphatase family protein [Bacteroidales bacterium]|nr:endonuclease/exonuclease/phosphatase family protein [Bacteroidales bacterium]